MYIEAPGKRVLVRSTKEEDFSALLILWNDGLVMKSVGFPQGLGYDMERVSQWYTWLQESPHRHHFVVHSPELGFCGEVYYETDSEHRRAGLDIKFIPMAQGRGLATDALRTIINLVFESEPEIEAVWTEPSPENLAARKLYQRCGLAEKERPADLPEGFSYWELNRVDWGKNQSSWRQIIE